MPNFRAAAIAILQGMDVIPTNTNVNLLDAWIRCEKGDNGDAWQWNNPLNTTIPGYGAVSNANSAGVKIYPSPAQGIAATVATLQNGLYPDVVHGLQTSNPSIFFSRSGLSQIGTWGTNPGCVQSVYQTLPSPGISTTGTPTTSTPSTSRITVVPSTSTVFVTPTSTTSTPTTSYAIVQTAGVGYPITNFYTGTGVTVRQEFTSIPPVEQTLPFNERLRQAIPTTAYQAEPIVRTSGIPTTATPAPSILPWILGGLLLYGMVEANPRWRQTVLGGHDEPLSGPF